MADENAKFASNSQIKKLTSEEACLGFAVNNCYGKGLLLNGTNLNAALNYLDCKIEEISEVLASYIFEIDGDDITFGFGTNTTTVTITHPVLSEQQNPNGTTSLLVDGTTVYTTPIFTSSTDAASGEHQLFANGVLVGTWDDQDTISSPHPDYTLTKDAVTGDISLELVGGPVVATVSDNDTVSTPHPEVTFEPNTTNGTDVFVDGVLVHNIPDTDTVIMQTGPNEYTFSEGGNVLGTVDTIPDKTQSFVVGSRTILPNGDIQQCLTTVWTEHPTIASGTPVTAPDDACFTIPVGDTDTTLTQFSSSQATGCRLTDDTSAASPATIDVFMSKSWRHDSADITSYTNTCRHTVSNSLLSNALADRSHVDVSTRGTASGIMSHATGVNNATASGLRSGVISSDGVEASGTGATAISSNGGLLVSGTSSSGIAVRAVNPSEIRNNWAVGIATFDPNIGLTGPAGVYNFIGGGGANTANWSYSGSVHSIRTLADNIGAALYASSDSHAIEERSTVISSQGIINPKPYSTRWGNVGPTATPLSSNTRAEIDSTMGDITTIGTITASATPFPGVTECAVVKKEIPIGTAVRFEGEYGARVCKDGERPHGVTKGKAGICAGGGIDPNNAPFVIEGGVYKRVKRLDVSEHEVVDEVATAPILAKYELDIEKYEVAVAKWTVAVSKADKDGPLPKKPTAPEFKPVMKMQKVETEVEAYEVNKSFDEEKHKSLIQSNIEMLGRTWMNTKESIKVDSKNPVYLGANGKIVDPSLGFEVIAARKGEALVFVK